jgi:hypothetical protein
MTSDWEASGILDMALLLNGYGTESVSDLSINQQAY